MSGRRPALAAALGWMLVILWFSTPAFSADRTEALLAPALAWLAPWLDAGDARLVNKQTRRLAHLVEYAALAALWMAALRASDGQRLRYAAWAVVAICATWAAVDEAHQALAAARAGRLADVAVDVSGAASMVAFIGMWDRWREKGQSRATSPA